MDGRFFGLPWGGGGKEEAAGGEDAMVGEVCLKPGLKNAGNGTFGANGSDLRMDANPDCRTASSFSVDDGTRSSNARAIICCSALEEKRVVRSFGSARQLKLETIAAPVIRQTNPGGGNAAREHMPHGGKLPTEASRNSFIWKVRKIIRQLFVLGLHLSYVVLGYIASWRDTSS
jgi:hypothetical protein